MPATEAADITSDYGAQSLILILLQQVGHLGLNGLDNDSRGPELYDDIVLSQQLCDTMALTLHLAATTQLRVFPIVQNLSLLPKWQAHRR